jgi:hypothetical protein
MTDGCEDDLESDDRPIDYVRKGWSAMKLVRSTERLVRQLSDLLIIPHANRRRPQQLIRQLPLSLSPLAASATGR